MTEPLVLLHAITLSVLHPREDFVPERVEHAVLIVVRLTWLSTARMNFHGWPQHDTLATGHGHCRDNRRQHTAEVQQIMRSLADRGLRLHGFGIKITGLGRYADSPESADSASWSLHGRHVPGCSPDHQSESNCVRFALAWHAKLLTTLHAKTSMHHGNHTPSDTPTPVTITRSRHQPTHATDFMAANMREAS